MTKFYVQEKRVFDINKVTVVGSPSISEDGVASGFTTANYIASSTTLTINPNIFRICFEFTTGSDITTTQMIIRSLDGQNAFIVGLKSRKMRLYLNEGGSPLSWGVASDILSTKILTANTKYNGYLGFNGSTYTLSLNNEDWITVKSSALIRSSFALKIGQGMSTEPFLGSVDIQAIRVYSNNELIYSPTKPICYLERRKEGFDLSKFTVVGTPTITEDGVASGFSNTIHFSPIINLLNPNNIKISISGILSELTGTSARTYFNLTNGDNTLRLYLNNQNKLSGEVGSVTSGNHRYLGGDSYPLPLNAKFKTILNIDVKNNTVQQVVYINNELLFEGPKQTPTAFNFDTDFVFSSATMKLGAGGYNGFTGSIDLSQFSITVDGKEVFTGAKEKFYAMRGM